MSGETLKIRIRSENTFAFSSTGNTSRTMALGATIPTQPPRAWKKRKTIRTSTEGANAHPMEVIIYRTRPTYSGPFLPNRSSNGPQINCPKQTPIKKLDKEYETVCTDAWRLAATPGKPGRYISIEKGTIADNNPNRSININLDNLFWFLVKNGCDALAAG